MDFRSSLELLARKAGVDLSVYDNNGGQELAKLKKRLLHANELAANYYQHCLINNQHAMDYVFGKRGLSKQIVQDFKIGYAPTSGDALVNFLQKKGFTNNEISQVGLANQYGGDLFRGRMTIPLMDGVGQVIGFTGRIIINDDKAPKYLNTPQTILYDKSRHVFGLSQAKEAIRLSDYAVIVEGNLDVISSHQVGINQVVATAGTAMTESHLKALVRLSSHIRLAFDGDKAGLAATERAIPIAQNVGVDLTIISLPDTAKDPDELIQQDPKLWQNAIDNAKPAVDWVIEQYSLREDLSMASGKRRFTTAALGVVGMLQDSVEQEYYISKISKLSDSSPEALKAKLFDREDQPQKEYRKPVQPTETARDPDHYQDNLLAAALIDNLAHDLFAQVDAGMFIGEERQAVARYLSEHGDSIVIDTPPQLQKYDIYVKILLLKADTRYADWNDTDRRQETARLLRQVINENRQKQKDILTEQLRDAENLGDDTKANEARNQLNKLIKEMQSGKR